MVLGHNRIASSCLWRQLAPRSWLQKSLTARCSTGKDPIAQLASLTAYLSWRCQRWTSKSCFAARAHVFLDFFTHRLGILSSIIIYSEALAPKTLKPPVSSSYRFPTVNQGVLGTRTRSICGPSPVAQGNSHQVTSSAEVKSHPKMVNLWGCWPPLCYSGK